MSPGHHRRELELGDEAAAPRLEGMTFASGCCFLMPAPVARAMGGFRENFLVYCEKVELSLRLTRAGHKLYYQAAARGLHREPLDKSLASPFAARHRDRNRCRLVRQHYSPLERVKFALWFGPTRFVRLTRYLSAAISKVRAQSWQGPYNDKMASLETGSRWASAMVCALVCASNISAQTQGADSVSPVRSSVRKVADHLLPLAWQTDAALVPCQDAPCSASLSPTESWVTVWYNARREYSPDIVWNGRGLTVAGSSGLDGRLWRFSFGFRPVASWTENRRYELFDDSAPVDPYNYPQFAGSIDLPYRMGKGPYGRIDPGSSYVRADLWAFGVGISSAPQTWGPAQFHPLVINKIAGGFPHVFVETNRLVSVGLGRVSARWIAGIISPSRVLESTGRTARHGVGLVGAFAPRGFDGMQIGASRFFHVRDTAARTNAVLTLPFGGLLKRGLKQSISDFNQVASVFAVIAPIDGVRLHSEFFREDHSWNLRDLIGEPDHISGYSFGLGVTRPDAQGGHRNSVAVEVVNSRITHLRNVRGQSAVYTHGGVSEGHTLRGRALGSPAAYGGSAIVLSWERIADRRRVGLLLERRNGVQDDQGGAYEGRQVGEWTVALSTGQCAPADGNELSLGLQSGFGGMPNNLFAGIRIPHLNFWSNSPQKVVRPGSTCAGRRPH
jgi:hypothetical protein